MSAAAQHMQLDKKLSLSNAFIYKLKSLGDVDIDGDDPTPQPVHIDY